MRKYLVWYFLFLSLVFVPDITGKAFAEVKQRSYHQPITATNTTTAIIGYGESVVVQVVHLDLDAAIFPSLLGVWCGDLIANGYIATSNGSVQNFIPDNVFVSYVCEDGVFAFASSTLVGPNANVTIKYLSCSTIEECNSAISILPMNGVTPENITENCAHIDGNIYCYKTQDVYIGFFLEFLVVAITIIGIVWVFKKKRFNN